MGGNVDGESHLVKKGYYYIGNDHKDFERYITIEWGEKVNE